LRQAIEAGWYPGPRIYCSGQALTMTGGHGWTTCGAEADGADGVRRLARQQFKNGADCLKLMTTGGAGSHNARLVDLQFTGEEIQAATEEAHKKGQHAMAHVSTADGVRLAVNSGVDCIEHGLILDEDAVALMARKGTYYDPTMFTYERIVREGHQRGYTPNQIERAREIAEPHRHSLKLALKAGLKIVAGTDAGFKGRLMQTLPDELATLVDCGMTPAAALMAATATAAECLGASELVGSLKPGSWGDVLLVEGNPLDDISALKKVWGVFKGGKRLC
jgi:imidazolonepropionase-like amidohydrolase